MVDKRIMLLFANGPAGVMDMLESDSLSDIETLDFLFDRFTDQVSDRLEVEAVGVGESFLAVGLTPKVRTMPPETKVALVIPVPRQHYRDLEYPHESRVSYLRKIQSGKTRTR